MTEEEMRAALVEAMTSSARGNTYAQWTDTILPTVRRIAAEELRAAAADCSNAYARMLNARADALDPS